MATGDFDCYHLRSYFGGLDHVQFPFFFYLILMDLLIGVHI